MTQTESEKAIRYISSLDYARCDANWPEVPEFARKVAKHAPKRKLLVQTAKSETLITNTNDHSELDGEIPKLEKALSDSTNAEDLFQGTVCLAWLQWLRKNYQATDDLLKQDFSQTISATKSQWVLVCASKRAFIRGFALERLGDATRAIAVYRDALPLIKSLATSSLTTPSTPSLLASELPEYRLWTERLLCRYVACTLEHFPPATPSDFEQILSVFHLWVPLVLANSPEFRLGLEANYSRQEMWMAYYSILSLILTKDYVYSPNYSDTTPKIQTTGEALTDEVYIACRLKQHAELKSVEAKIEINLKSSFPRAADINDQVKVENWADAVMSNWRILCGPNWHDDEIGAGGKMAITRGVLDILYRAAERTFHSTQLLRHLFTIHTYLAEFELAFRALDTYLELITSARVRLANSGCGRDHTLDRNDQVLATMAEAILVLCKFGGRRKDAEKTQKIAERLQLWMQESEFDDTIPENATMGGFSVSSLDMNVTAPTMARAFYALGIAEAHWAQIAYDPASREQHHTNALDHLKQATHRKYGNSKNLTYLFSQAFVLAQIGDIDGALKATDSAIREASMNAAQDDGSYDTERKLIKFWHLFALLLTAKTEMLNAAKVSTAAFKQFQDSSVLFGQQVFRSEHLNETVKMGHTAALVDAMDTEEKIGILQVKMTQVALLEVLEGTEQAIDACPSLWELYALLFGYSATKFGHEMPKVAQRPPKSRLGSIKADIIRAVSRKGRRDIRAGRDKPDLSSPQTTASASVSIATAPAIKVTEVSTDSPVGSKGRKLNGTRGSVKVPSGSERSQSPRPHSQAAPGLANGETSVPEKGKIKVRSSRSSLTSSVRPSTAGSSSSRVLPFHSLGASRHRKRDSRVSMQTIDSDGGAGGESSTLPALFNVTVPAEVEKRHSTRMLIELWLFISGMYCRSQQFENAYDAVDEAQTLVLGMQEELAQMGFSSAKAFLESGWGGGKCADELMADVLSQRGQIAQGQETIADAIAHYEEALDYWPNHGSAIVGLCGLLLDSVEEKKDSLNIHLEMKKREIDSTLTNIQSQTSDTTTPLYPGSPRLAMTRTTTGTSTIYQDAQSVITNTGSFARYEDGSSVNTIEPTKTIEAITSQQAQVAVVSANTNNATANGVDETTPEQLELLAARDRAYFLLGKLTKLGAVWNYPEAWSELARAYELSGQIEKAKEKLWFCVDLEDSKPLRGWHVVVGWWI